MKVVEQIVLYNFTLFNPSKQAKQKSFNEKTSEVSGVDLAPPKKEKAPKQEQKVNEEKAAAKAAKKAEAKAKKAAHKAKEQAEKGAGDQKVHYFQIKNSLITNKLLVPIFFLYHVLVKLLRAQKANNIAIFSELTIKLMELSVEN